jgi:hypothetical protein
MISKSRQAFSDYNAIPLEDEVELPETSKTVEQPAEQQPT